MTAEQMLHEAQYAFASITFGESRDNTRNRSRARSLCRKIMRKFPGSMEAGEARAILKRMGEEAFTSTMRVRHRHSTPQDHHRAQPLAIKPAQRQRRARQPAMTPEQRTFVTERAGGDESVNWGGLIGLVFRAPRFVLGIVAVAVIFAWGILGPLLLLPLVALIVVTGPGRVLLGRQQRAQVNAFVAAVNAWIEDQ